MLPPPPPSSDSKLGYLDMNINCVLVSSIDQFTKRDYTDIDFNFRQLQWIVKRLEELKPKWNKPRSFKLFMTLVFNRFMAYLSNPDDESRVAELCKVVFDDQSAFALSYQELKDLQSHLCKHLIHLINQNFFVEFKDTMDEYVDKYGVWVAIDCGTASQMTNYSLEQMCQVMDEYLKQYVADRTSSVLHHLSKHYYKLIGKDGEENELIDGFSSSHARQREASEKRKNDESQLRDSPTAAAPTPLAHNNKKPKLTSKDKIIVQDSNIKLSPRVVVPSPARSSRSATKTTTAAAATTTSQDTEQSSTTSTTSRPLQLLDSKKTRLHVEAEEKRVENTNYEMDVPDLDFGDENDTEKVVIKKKKKRNQLAEIETNISPLRMRNDETKKSDEEDSTKKGGASSDLLTFKRPARPTVVSSNSNHSAGDEDQENRHVVDSRAASNTMTVALFARDAVDLTEVSGTESTETNRATTSKKKKKKKKSVVVKKQTGIVKKRWTHNETLALALGVRRHGKGYWSFILADEDFEDELEGRDNVQLKDKWRVLEKNQIEMRLYERLVEDAVSKGFRTTPL